MTPTTPTSTATSADTFSRAADNAQRRDVNRDLATERKTLQERISELEAVEDKLSVLERRELIRGRQRVDDINVQLINDNTALLNKMIAPIVRGASNDNAEEYRAAARAGLVAAVMSYDPEQGLLGGWMHRTIKKETLHALRQREYMNMNRNQFEQRPKVLAALASLRTDQFEPTMEQVAAHAGVSVDTVRHVLNPPRIDSLSSPVGGDDDSNSTLADVVADATASDAFDAVLANLDVDTLRDVVSTLPAREQYVLNRRFGIDGAEPQKLSTIGDTLGVSREAIRVLENRALSLVGHPGRMRRLVRNNR